MILLKVILAMLVLFYTFASLLRFRVIERRVPASLIICNLLFLLFYCLGFCYQAFNSISHGRFMLAAVGFYYSESGVIAISFILFQYILAIEIINAVTVLVFRNRTRPAEAFPFSVPVWGFVLVAGWSALTVGTLLFRIVTTVGIPYFIAHNILRSVFFEGLGIVVELLFVAVFMACVLWMIAAKQRWRWFVLFVVTGFITLTRWPLVLMILAFLCFLFYVKRRRFLQVKYLFPGVTIIIAAVSVAILTRPSADTWEGPLQVIYGTEQAPQMPALLIARDSMALKTSLSTRPFAFVGEMIPRQFKAPFGISEAITGNQAFTKTHWTSRLENDQSEMSFGGLNELYFRGGFALILAILMLLPLAYGTITSQVRNANTLFIVEAALCWFVFQLLRSDMAHTFSRIPSLALGSFVAIVIVNAGYRAALQRARRARERAAMAAQAAALAA